MISDEQNELPTRRQLDEQYLVILRGLRDPLSQYTDYLDASGSFQRIVDFSVQLGVDLSFWKNKTVLDIGGGTVQRVDYSNIRMPRYFPWFSVAMHLLGAQPYSIDKDQQPDPGLFFGDHDQNLVRAVESSYTHIAKNLAESINTPTVLTADLKKNYPALANGVNLVNCRHLIVTSGDMSQNSPLFMKDLGVTLNVDDVPDDTVSNNEILEHATDGIFQVAQDILKESGAFFFNDQLFQKRGDKLVVVA